MDYCYRFDEYFEPTPQKSQAQLTTSINTNHAQYGNNNQDTPTTPACAYLSHQD